MIHTKSILAAGLLSALALGCAHDEGRTTASRSSSTQGSESRRDGDDHQAADDRDSDARRDGAPATVATREERIAPDLGDGNGNGVPPTAQDQSSSDGDVEITRRIREACINDGSLSVRARNVTIVTRSGVVTLRGDVASAAERGAVERHAYAVSGVNRVDNRIDISQ